MQLKERKSAIQPRKLAQETSSHGEERESDSYNQTNITGKTCRPQQKTAIKTEARRASLTARTVLYATITLFIIQGKEAKAEWNLQHATDIEDLLKKYTQTLPSGNEINKPRLFLYRGEAFSRACPRSGIAAPAYCPGDNTIYLEISLGDQVADSFGDFDALSILAHEYGHAYLDQMKQHPKGKPGELAADRLAGGFARYVEAQGFLEQGDIDEALATFAAVGDYEVYHHDHHGTPAERRQAFEQGYLQGFKLPNSDYEASPAIMPENKPIDPKTTHQGQVPTTTSPTTPDHQAVIPALGLGLGLLMTVGIIAAVVSIVRRAQDDEY